MKNLLKKYILSLTLLLASFLFISCGTTPHPSNENIVETEQIDKDTSCSYFYFLWGTHEEYNHHYQEALEAYQKALICDPAEDYIRNKIPILYLKMEQPSKAVELLNRELAENPEDLTNRSLLARIYIQQRNSEEATKQYLEIISREPENEQALLRLGALLSQDGDFENSRRYFSKLLEINPESYFSRLYLARIADRLDETAEAEKQYLSVLELNWSEDLIFEISDFYQQRKEFEKSLKLLRSAQKKGSNNERMRLTIVQTLLALNKEEEAIAELSIEKKSHGNAAHFSLVLSKLHLRNGNKKKAVENLEVVLEAEDNSEARYLLAVIYADSSEYNKALDVLEKISPKHEEFEQEVSLKSRILHQEDRGDEALEMMQGYLSEKSTRKPIFYIITSSLLRDQKKLDEATRTLELGLNHFPSDKGLLFEYGLQLERTDRLEEAITVMEQIIEKNPDHAEALNFVGYSWADTNRNLDKAYEYVVKAMRLKPNNGYIQDSLGWIHFKLGHLKIARSELIGALKLVPDDPYIHEHLGDVYLALGFVEKALAEYYSALQFYEDEDKKQILHEKISNIKKP